MKTVVCPHPQDWARIAEELSVASEVLGLDGKPPIPLILSGWGFSNDSEKRERWQDTVAWAEARGLGHIVKKLPPEEFYSVENLTTYMVGPGGGPMYLRWDFESKPKIQSDERARLLQLLDNNWAHIAEPETARSTSPLKITGTKGRRLLVCCNASAVPPWGTWTSLGYSEKRRHFTRLRTAVNQAIAPHMVDHIDFVATLRWKQASRLTNSSIR